MAPRVCECRLFGNGIKAVPFGCTLKLALRPGGSQLGSPVAVRELRRSSSSESRVREPRSSVRWQPHVSSFKFTPQLGQSPLQSGRQSGLMGMASSISSRKIGPISIFPFSGNINPDSVTEFDVKAYNSVKSISNGCIALPRQRTHSVSAVACILTCRSKPWAVRVIRALPVKLLKSRSGGKRTDGTSNGNSRL